MTRMITERHTSLVGQQTAPDVALSMRRFAVAALFALLASLLVPATASAQSSEPDTSAYVGSWSGPTRHMTLKPDGTGYLSVSDGSSGGEAWSLSWSGLPGSIVIALETRAMVEGNGLGGALTPDTWWYASLQRIDGVTVLRLVDSLSSSAMGTYWCNPDVYGYVSACDG